MNNVIFLIDSLSRSGGLERYIQSSCELLKDDFKTHVIEFNGKDSNKPFFKLPLDTTIHKLPAFKKNSYLARFPKGTLLTHFINKTLKSIDGEFVIIPVGTRVLEYALKYLADDYKIIACEHRNSENASGFKEAKKIRSLSRKAACWKALTKFDQKNYEKINDRSFFVPNYTPGPEEFVEKTHHGKCDIVSLGHVYPRKAFDRAIEFLLCVDDKFKQGQISYSIYGDRTFKKKHVKKVDDLAAKLKNIEVTFYEPVDDLEAIFKKHNVYLMSSKEEAFGLVLIEAKSYGLPCVSLDAKYSSGPREIIRDKVDGFVCKSEAEFLEGLKKLIEPQTYKRLSEKSFEDYKARFSKGAALENWKVMLNEVFSPS